MIVKQKSYLHFLTLSNLQGPSLHFNSVFNIYSLVALRLLNATVAAAERIRLKQSYTHLNLNLMEYAIVTCQILPCLNDKAVILISLLTCSRHFCWLSFPASNRLDFINIVLTKVLKAHTKSHSTFNSLSYFSSHTLTQLCCLQ